MPIRPYLKDAIFEPEHVTAMGKAFDSVIRGLNDRGLSLSCEKLSPSE